LLLSNASAFGMPVMKSVRIWVGEVAAAMATSIAYE
jgi:hypothetical protein